MAMVDHDGVLDPGHQIPHTADGKRVKHARLVPRVQYEVDDALADVGVAAHAASASQRQLVRDPVQTSAVHHSERAAEYDGIGAGGAAPPEWPSGGSNCLT